MVVCTRYKSCRGCQNNKTCKVTRVICANKAKKAPVRRKRKVPVKRKTVKRKKTMVKRKTPVKKGGMVSVSARLSIKKQKLADLRVYRDPWHIPGPVMKVHGKYVIKMIKHMLPNVKMTRPPSMLMAPMVNSDEQVQNYIKGLKKLKPGIYATYLTLKKNISDSHANMLVAKVQRNNIIINRFDPHGDTKMYPGAENILKYYVKKAPGVKYVGPVSVCPSQIQKKEWKFKGRRRGYCVIWTLLWLYYRIKNPNKTNAQISSFMTKKPAPQLQHRVEGLAIIFAKHNKIKNRKK